MVVSLRIVIFSTLFVCTSTHPQWRSNASLATEYCHRYSHEWPDAATRSRKLLRQPGLSNNYLRNQLQQTQALDPPLSIVPWILVAGQQTDSAELILNNLFVIRLV